MGSTLSFKRPDGQAVQGYLAEPRAPQGAPAVVVIQEWWGLNDQIRGVADRLAAPATPPWCPTCTAARARSRPRRPTT
jgi:dienelactone hydrolase